MDTEDSYVKSAAREDKSGLVLYSVGVVVENKPEKTDIILVTPIEKLNIQESGLINEKVREYKNNDLPDMYGTVQKAEIKGTNKIKAKWIPFGHSNRITAPDVYAGETVILFKYEDVDEYFWTTIFREPSIRRLETVLYAFSNQKEYGKTFDKKTSYWLEVDTRNKKVTFFTAKNDNEYTSFTVSFDTKEGLFTLTDDNGNSIVLDSQKNSISITAQDIYLNGNVHIGGNFSSPNLNTIGEMIADGGIDVFGKLNANGGIEGI